MACPLCRFLAWLQGKMSVRAQDKAVQLAPDATLDAARTERLERARSLSFARRRFEPPPTPLPAPQDAENLEALRARVPPRSRLGNREDIFLPPPPTDTMEKACRAAAGAVEYPILAAISEPERELAAAQTARAIATAVSTSPSHPVLVAAVTMAESKALIWAENPYRSHHFNRTPPDIEKRRRLNALNAAIRAGMAVHAEDMAHHERNAPRPDDDDFNGSDPPAYVDCVSGYPQISTGTHATQPDPDPQDVPDWYIASQLILRLPGSA